MQPLAEKVTAFVTRSSAQGVELLLFEHPYAGIQLPAGTVEANEPHVIAAAREASEETGLTDIPAGRFLQSVEETLPDGHLLVTVTTPVYARPDTTSFDWASIRRGILVKCLRTVPEFTQITYIERDEQADPSYISYQITGWVASAVLTPRVTRHFYHFPYHGQTPDSWWVDTDNHRFRLFWAPLNDLPMIRITQHWWPNILMQALSAHQYSDQL